MVLYFLSCVIIIVFVHVLVILVLATVLSLLLSLVVINLVPTSDKKLKLNHKTDKALINKSEIL